MSKPRGRFDVLVVDDDGDGYVRFTSNKERSLPKAEIIEQLQKFIGILQASGSGEK